MIAVGVPRKTRREAGFLLPAGLDGSDPIMSFYSILFETPADRTGSAANAEPAFFPDLNCDQIVDAIIAGRDEFDLRPFFQALLHRHGAILYRQNVMQDLENAGLYDSLVSFARSMRELRDHLGRVEKLHSREQRQAWFLDAVEGYCDAIASFARELGEIELQSSGFQGFRDYLTRYARSAQFTALASEAKNIRRKLDAVDYCVLVKGSSFTVRKSEGEADYSAEMEATFDKFRQGQVKDYRVKFAAHEEMNHIEAKILDFVIKLHPDLFADLREFCARNRTFRDLTVVTFDREVQFYVAYLDYIAALRRAGLLFCYPRVVDDRKEVHGKDSFDIALAHKLLREAAPIVYNDFELTGSERILVVSGPNQGGKTTFARTFGQLHFLANIGCPVPGRAAQLLLFDRLLTHFESEEKVENLRGKLEDDLVRIHDILDQATSQSIVILNEVFASTTLKDEIVLSEKIMRDLIRRDLLGVWVTFVDELTSFGPQTVSMVSAVMPDDPAKRTFKVTRRPADGLAYAMSIAQKYGLTYEAVKDRIAP
jgi:DNA mismatch repair protein MutS